MRRFPSFTLRYRWVVLSVDDLPVVEMAQPVDELVDVVLCFGDSQFLSPSDHFEHILMDP